MGKWADLPGEILFKISQSCSQTDGMRGTCKDWQTALESNSSQLAVVGSSLPLTLALRFISLRTLDLSGCEHISSTALDALRGSPVISLKLELEMNDLSNEILQSLRGLSLASLDLQLNEGEEPEAVPEDWLKKLAGLPVVRLHCLWPLTFTEEILSPMRGMPLTDLSLLGTAPEHLDPKSLVDPAVFVPVHGMSLTALRLTSDGSLSWDDGDLSALHGMPLKTLKLDRTYFSNEGLGALQGLPLTDLDLSQNLNLGMDVEISDTGLQVLRGMPLVSLRLAHFAGVSGVEFLGGSPLTWLCLEGCGITSLEGLEGSPLTFLNLSETRIRDDALGSLRGMQTLTSLNLLGCLGIDGYGFSALEQLPLRALDADESNENMSP